MILIADSGSTKCDWALILPGNSIEFSTIGINPLFRDEETIVRQLQQSKGIREYCEAVDTVFYYGAGSGSPELKEILQNALQRVFPQAEIHSESDLLAAAVATFGEKPCISCILGTGANSCFYDGKVLIEKSPALGYILGDEASGAYFGKKLLAAFLYEKMPLPLQQQFEEDYRVNKKEIIKSVYKRPDANVYLASFMPFLHRNKSEQYIQKILRKGFRKFLLIHVMCFEQSKSIPVHFVGSVAWFFKEELRRQAEQLNIKTGRIIQRPVDGLMQYHRKILNI